MEGAVEEVVELDYDESGLEDDQQSRVPRRATGKKGSACPLCPYKFTHVRRHLLVDHLPWYVSPTTACWFCGKQEQQASHIQAHMESHLPHQRVSFPSELASKEYALLMNGFLHELRRCFGLASLGDFLRLVVDKPKLHPSGNTPLRPADRELMELFLRSNNWEVPCRLSISPPNCVASLLHWRILANLVAELDVVEQHRLRTFAQRVDGEGRVLLSFPPDPPKRLEVVDSHFHLDIWCRNTGCSSLEEILRLPKRGPPSEVRCQFVLGIANYCWPRHWPSAEMRERHRQDPRIRTTFGLHPRVTSDVGLTEQRLDDYLSHMEQVLLREREVVGVGECGLDYTIQGSDREEVRLRQEKYLVKQMQLAVSLGLPVVIHCRDQGSGEAARRCLGLARSVLPSGHPIQRHCFTGTFEEYRDWAGAFPHCVFGISPILLKDARLQLTVRQIPTNRLTLETDAPYLGDSHEYLGELARMVSHLHRTNTDFVLQVTTRVAYSLYGVQPPSQI